MVRAQWMAASLLAGALVTSAARAADEIKYVDGQDGVKYQEITQRIQRPITDTRYESREYTAYRERYTTDYQEVQRNYQVAVTQQQWVPGYQRTWNVFAPPVLSYRLMPVTRMENRSETVRVPVTKRELIPEQRVQQVPVTTQRLAQEEHVHRIPVGHTGGSALVARSDAESGGRKMESDPPKTGTGTSDWRGGLEPHRP